MLYVYWFYWTGKPVLLRARRAHTLSVNQAFDTPNSVLSPPKTLRGILRAYSINTTAFCKEFTRSLSCCTCLPIIIPTITKANDLKRPFLVVWNILKYNLMAVFINCGNAPWHTVSVCNSNPITYKNAEMTNNCFISAFWIPQSTISKAKMSPFKYHKV